MSSSVPTVKGKLLVKDWCIFPKLTPLKDFIPKSWTSIYIPNYNETMEDSEGIIMIHTKRGRKKVTRTLTIQYPSSEPDWELKDFKLIPSKLRCSCCKCYFPTKMFIIHTGFCERTDQKYTQYKIRREDRKCFDCKFGNTNIYFTNWQGYQHSITPKIIEKVKYTSYTKNITSICDYIQFVFWYYFNNDFIRPKGELIQEQSKLWDIKEAEEMKIVLFIVYRMIEKGQHISIKKEYHRIKPIIDWVRNYTMNILLVFERINTSVDISSDEFGEIRKTNYDNTVISKDIILMIMSYIPETFIITQFVL